MKSRLQMKTSWCITRWKEQWNKYARGSNSNKDIVYIGWENKYVKAVEGETKRGFVEIKASYGDNRESWTKLRRKNASDEKTIKYLTLDGTIGGVSWSFNIWI